MGHSEHEPAAKKLRPWNAGRLVGAKRALKAQQFGASDPGWRASRLRDQAMFDLAIDSELRGCDVVKVRIGDLVTGGVQQKTGRPVQFEMLESTRARMLAWLECRGGAVDVRLPEPVRWHCSHQHPPICSAGR